MVVLFLAAALLCLSDPGASDLDDSIAALRRGDFAAAETKLRAVVAAEPKNAFALSLLGAALDNEKKSGEADSYHKTAVALDPRSAEVLNNYAVHLLMAGNQAESKKLYLRIVGIDPANLQANLQLAQIALRERNGADALEYLSRMPENPQTLPLRVNALYLAGRAEEADRILKADPANFGLLYVLGVSATQTRHYARAVEVLDTALRQQPANADVLLALAAADDGLKRPEAALELLAKAAKIAPGRPDIQKTIAITASEIGALDDALKAWDRYIAIVPTDGLARRERAFTLAKMGKVEEGLPVIKASVAEHPEDVLGHFELAQLDHDPVEYTRALEIDPGYVPALIARSGLYYQEGKPELAVKDLETAVHLEPDNAANLDRLGQTYQALDRVADALSVLKKASELAPGDSKILLHYGRALADAGKTEESRAVMDRFRQAPPEKKPGVPAGFLDYLALSPGQRQSSYRARTEKAAREKPEDITVQMAWFKVLLGERRTAAAESVAKHIGSLRPAPAVLAEMNVDLAMGDLNSDKPSDALMRLDKTPSGERDANYSFVRAQALQAAGRRAESKSELEKALAAAPDNRVLLLMKAVDEEAEPAFVELENRWPEWYPAWAGQGMVLADEGKFASARKALETALALGGQAPEVYFYLALCQLRLGADNKDALAKAGDDKWAKALAAGNFEKPPYLERLGRITASMR